jgi:hypothetical protein
MRARRMAGRMYEASAMLLLRLSQPENPSICRLAEPAASTNTISAPQAV